MEALGAFVLPKPMPVALVKPDPVIVTVSLPAADPVFGLTAVTTGTVNDGGVAILDGSAVMAASRSTLDINVLPLVSLRLQACSSCQSDASTKPQLPRAGLGNGL